MGKIDCKCNKQLYDENNIEIIKKRESFKYTDNQTNSSFFENENNLMKINEENQMNEDLIKEKNLKEGNKINKPNDEFSKYMFENINKLRKNPKNYIELIEKSKKNIKLLKNGKYIYNSTLKVTLYKGEESFNEAIEDLKKTNTMNELIYEPKITIPLPDNETDLQSHDYLKKETNKLKIKGYWRDFISDPIICFILLIVDDNNKFPGLKRKNLLDPNIKYIGISSKKIGKSFCSYFTLSNNDNL
jgi:hypothetical protein